MLVVKYEKGTIIFSEQANSYCIKDFCSAVEKAIKNNDSNITLDFSKTERAYPNGMVPIIAKVESLRSKNIKIDIILPNSYNARKLFNATNWAYMLSPEIQIFSESVHDRHLVTRKFTNAEDQKKVVDDFMDVVLRNLVAPRAILSGLEWAINEITDNVLNHSESNHGGIIQASTYPQKGFIAFAVADSGRGILNSLREGIPTLRTDSQAIGEAIKAGVTRNPKFGQGNGLAGTVRITTMSGGSFELISGKSRLLVTSTESIRSERNLYESYQGTIVCGQIKISDSFSIEKALLFDGKPHTPVDFIEINYESDDSTCHNFILKDETTGYGTRHAGRQIRTKALNLLNADSKIPLVIDWAGIPVISSSFADEFMGKLFLELGALGFSARIRNRGLEQLTAALIDKAIAQRLTQAVD